MPLLTLADAKRQLDIETSSSDAELQLYVDAVIETIEGYVGPVDERVVTETLRGQGATVVLQRTPVLSLTSLTPVLSGGMAVDVSRLHVDGASGVLSYLDGSLFSGGPWAALYRAGRLTTPPTFRLASALLLQHLWRTKHGAARGGSTSDDFSVNEPVPGFGYAVPNRVLQLLGPLPPAVA